MAKKEHSDIISSFAKLKEFKNIDNSTMLSILEEAFRKVISNIYGSDQNYDFIFNPDKGDFEIWRNRIVVEDEQRYCKDCCKGFWVCQPAEQLHPS